MKKLVVLGGLVAAVCSILTFGCNRGDTSTNVGKRASFGDSTAYDVSTERLGVEFLVPMSDSVVNAFAARNGLRLLRHRPSGTYEFELDRSVLPPDTTAASVARRLLEMYPDTVHFAAATGPTRHLMDDSSDWAVPRAP